MEQSEKAVLNLLFPAQIWELPEKGNFDVYGNPAYPNLDPHDYDGDHYSMWDAQQLYWYGYEWTK
ncbi:MAG: hypothetical protein ACFNQA_05070, partial [Flavobacteriaceae bacterium]